MFIMPIPEQRSLSSRRAALLELIRGGKDAGIRRSGLILAHGLDDPAMDMDLRHLIASGRVVIREPLGSVPTYFAAEWSPEP